MVENGSDKKRLNVGRSRRCIRDARNASERPNVGALRRPLRDSGHAVVEEAPEKNSFPTGSKCMASELKKGRN